MHCGRFGLRNDVLLLTAVALATAVEMVEALTIVLAVGVTRGWRATMLGVGAALVALGIIIVALGSAVAQIPLSALRVAVGGLLLVFGIQWLRKAILRASGYKSLHDEEQIFAREQTSARNTPKTGAFDGYSFTIAFKGVLLEGLEVVFIVLTFGASQHRVALSAVVALATALVVALVGVLIHKPLSRVPENSLKFVVGLLLTTFGIFWSTEGAGVHWPESDLAIPLLLLVLAAVSVLFVHALKKQHGRDVLAKAVT
jgi:uncharacterized membrane protein